MPATDAILQTAFWSAATIAFYLVARFIYQRRRSWWSSPMVLTPFLLIALALKLHESYSQYIRQTHWLLALIGPATVAFAVPIWEQRKLIRDHWPILIVGIFAGSATAMASAWGFAKLLSLDETLRLSLLPRSVSTPFAMPVSARFGGVPELTAIFVIFTGIFGAALGEVLLNLLPLRSVLARGSLFGMGAHGVGTAKAHQIGPEEGAIAGLVMSLAGLLNVFAAPLVVHLLR